MLRPRSLARVIASNVPMNVVAMPVTTVSGPPNLNRSRVVASLQATPWTAITALIRLTTSPAVSAAIREASSRDRQPDEADRHFRNDRLEPVRADLHPGRFVDDAADRDEAFLHAGKRDVLRVGGRFPFLNFAGDDHVHIRQHRDRVLDQRVAGQQADPPHGQGPVADGADAARVPSVFFNWLASVSSVIAGTS